MTDPIFALNATKVSARHRRLGYDVELFVPTDAAHRSAVKAFMNGAYHEPFSHWAYVQILAHKVLKNVVHAGAFFGDMLDTYARCAGTVYAFEPVLENFFFAKRNVELIGATNVCLMNAGLGSEDAILDIVVTSASGATMGGGATFRAPTTPNRKVQRAPVFRIDSLPIRDLGLIQLDVEGFELEALTGGVERIRADRPIILVEDNAAACDGLLGELGYQFSFTKSGLRYFATDEDRPFVDSLQASTGKETE